MKSLALGLAAALFVAALSPAAALAASKPAAPTGSADPKVHAEAMAVAPGLIQQTHISCTPTDATLQGTAKQKDAATGKETTAKYYEVVCQEGLGYIIRSPDSGAPDAFDCLAMTVNKPKAGEDDKGKLFCRLAPNLDPLKGMGPTLTKAGVTCTPDQGRYVGSSVENALDQYEVSCPDGSAYIVQVPRLGSSAKLIAADCLNQQPGACQFFTKDKMVALFTTLAAPAQRSSCQISDIRYMGTVATSKTSYYEVGCADGKSGYVLQLDGNKKYVAAIDCARATTIASGCTLTSAVAAQTDEVNTYNRLAKQIGYPCNVKAYHSFGIDQSGREVVELACSDHPDGAITLLPVDKGQKGEFFNCARAEARQLKCTLTSATDTATKLSSQIVASGKSCKVAKYRGVGIAADGSDYVEVTCTGEPGLMLQYNPGSPETLKEAMACLTARGVGGGCKM